MATSAHEIYSSYGSCGGLRNIIAADFKRLIDVQQCDKAELGARYLARHLGCERAVLRQHDIPEDMPLLTECCVGRLNSRMARTFAKRFVAFVDILGFKSVVDRMADDPAVFRTVRDALKTAARQATRFEKYRSKFNAARRARKGVSFVRDMRLEMTAFSDSFVVSDTFPAWHVLAAVQALGSYFLESGILTRGGIVYGDTYHKGQVLFGPAVNAAYHLESEVARYPRILVSPEVVTAAWGYHKGLCKGRLFVRDNDGCWFVNVIAPTLSGWDALSERAAMSDELTHTTHVRDALTRLLKGARSNPAHLSKVMWLVNQFNATAASDGAIDISDESG